MLWSQNNIHVVFGNQNLNVDNLKEHYPDVEFRNIKQIHGNQIELSSEKTPEADGHFTTESDVGLIIKTADCLPIFIIDPVRNILMAVHAGWRGVVSQITLLAIRKLEKMGGLPETFLVFIGPHIRKQHFEVDEPVWVQLIDSIPVSFRHNFELFYSVQSTKSLNPFQSISGNNAEKNKNREKSSTLISNNKYLVDLGEIVKSQIREGGCLLENILDVNRDTFSEKNWNSYRRDKEKSGRNISFVTRIG